MRTLRRISIAFFRNKAKAATSKYALYTLIDLIVDLSASERTRRRMDNLVTQLQKAQYVKLMAFWAQQISTENA